MSNEKTQAVTALYKVGYTFITEQGDIRSGAIVIDTTSAEKAKEEAETRLATRSLRHLKISKVKAY